LLPSDWDDIDADWFKNRSQDPEAIIEKLKTLTASFIPFQGELPEPEDLNSTDPLDSLMTAVASLVSSRTTNFDAETQKEVHLATGTRTDFCIGLLGYLCQHLKVEHVFKDSVGFFMDSLQRMVKLEDENRKMKDTISNLLSLKEDSILIKFNLEKRLKEQVAKID
jgi:hypothetical protein